MNGWLLDTNILSELRKGNKCDSSVLNWMKGHLKEPLFISVLTIGEIRRGIEKLRRKDESRAFDLELWLIQIETDFSKQILPIDQPTAEVWGRITSKDPLPVADALIASSAMVHNLTVVTRNSKDFRNIEVAIFNPFL